MNKIREFTPSICGIRVVPYLFFLFLGFCRTLLSFFVIVLCLPLLFMDSHYPLTSSNYSSHLRDTLYLHFPTFSHVCVPSSVTTWLSTRATGIIDKYLSFSSYKKPKPTSWFSDWNSQLWKNISFTYVYFDDSTVFLILLFFSKFTWFCLSV